MGQGIELMVFPVKDIAQAKALYGDLLGVDPYVDQPYYVGFRVGELEIGLDPNGHDQGLSGPLAYCTVVDIEQRLQELVARGGCVEQPVKDVGGGKLTATLRDADLNLVGLLQAPS